MIKSMDKVLLPMKMAINILAHLKTGKEMDKVLLLTQMAINL